MKKLGIILAAGKSSRLYPTTLGVTKQLLPIYDKPLIYYPLSTLMLAKFQEILIITAPSELDIFRRLFYNHNLGINLNFTTQAEPKGIAEALMIAEFFYGQRPERTCLILGDNFFYGAGLSEQLWKAAAVKDKAVVFAAKVRDPERFGVVEIQPFDSNFHQATSIEEKPKKPKSNYAATGLYFYPKSAYGYVSKLKPSARGELEITDLNKIYLEQKNLFVNKLQRGTAWFDTGTPSSMLEASHFVQTIQDQQDILVGSPQEIGYNNGWMKAEDVTHFANKCKNDYGKYLKDMVHHGHE
mgnify:CR=1 FL=1